MMRSWRSDCRVAISSSMIFGTVSASERMAPVHGEQPSDRIRHFTFCGFSPGIVTTNGCSCTIERGAADDDLALLGEVERHDRECSRRGCTARRRSRSSSRAGTRGCSRPAGSCAFSRFQSSGRCRFGIPLAVVGRGSRTRVPWRATSPRRAARRRWPRRSCRPASPSRSDLVLSRPQQRCVPTLNGCVPSRDRLLVGVDDQPRADGSGHLVAELESFRGTCRWCRRAAAGTESGRGRTPSAPGAAAPTSPCRSNRASPAARTRPPPRA